jgi:cytochrome P450 family 2 subfamily U polypeptide 1
MHASVVFCATFILTYLIFKKCNNKKKSTGKQLNSLPCLPIVGSLPFLASADKLHEDLMEKAKRYGNVFALYSGNNYTVVLNGYDAIYNALVKKSTEFAGRKALYSEAAVLNVNIRGVIMKQYGEDYKKIHQLSLSILKQYGWGHRKIIEDKVHKEAYKLIDWFKSTNGEAIHPTLTLDLFVLNIISSLLFSRRFEPTDEVAIHLVEAMHEMMDSYDPALDTFPVVKYLPKYRRMLTKLAVTGRYMRNFFTEKIKECMSREDGDESFVKEYVQRSGDAYVEEDLIFLLRDLVLGGFETSAVTLSWALIEIGNHPAVQSRLQKEIDSVVTTDRLPSLDDEKKLKYAQATILELFRLRTIVPLGVPRLTVSDTELDGCTIPVNSTVIVNLWSAHMDPTAWNDPHLFKPDRFLNEEGNIVNRERVIVFGLGKRSCLGEILARQDIFLFLTAILQHFHILPPEGESSIVDEANVIRMLSPAPYKLRLIPRV